MAERAGEAKEAAGKVAFTACSEGQAAALYLCKSLEDPQHKIKRAEFGERVSDLDKHNGLNLFDIEEGGSIMTYSLPDTLARHVFIN